MQTTCGPIAIQHEVQNSNYKSKKEFEGILLGKYFGVEGNGQREG